MFNFIDKVRQPFTQEEKDSLIHFFKRLGFSGVGSFIIGGMVTLLVALPSIMGIFLMQLAYEAIGLGNFKTTAETLNVVIKAAIAGELDGGATYWGFIVLGALVSAMTVVVMMTKLILRLIDRSVRFGWSYISQCQCAQCRLNRDINERVIRVLKEIEHDEIKALIIKHGGSQALISKEDLLSIITSTDVPCGKAVMAKTRSGLTVADDEKDSNQPKRRTKRRNRHK